MTRFAEKHSGVGTEKIYRAEMRLGLGHKYPNLRFVRDLARYAQATALRRYLLGGAWVEVRDHHPRAFGREPPGKRRADSAASTGHNRGFVFQMHVSPGANFCRQPAVDWRRAPVPMGRTPPQRYI